MKSHPLPVGRFILSRFYVLFCDDIDEDSDEQTYIIEYYEVDSCEVKIYLCHECALFSQEEKLDLARAMIKEYEISEANLYQFDNKKKKSAFTLEKND